MATRDLDGRRGYRRATHFPTNLKFKTTRGQRAAIERKSDELGMSVSEVIRIAVRHGLAHVTADDTG